MYSDIIDIIVSHIENSFCQWNFTRNILLPIVIIHVDSHHWNQNTSRNRFEYIFKRFSNRISAYVNFHQSQKIFKNIQNKYCVSYKILISHDLKVVQRYFHVEKNRNPAGSLPPYVRVYSRRTTVPSIKAALPP